MIVKKLNYVSENHLVSLSFFIAIVYSFQELMHGQGSKCIATIIVFLSPIEILYVSGFFFFSPYVSISYIAIESIILI